MIVIAIHVMQYNQKDDTDSKSLESIYVINVI